MKSLAFIKHEFSISISICVGLLGKKDTKV
jgi:hypothetical protein